MGSLEIALRLRQGVDPDDIPETEHAMDSGATEIERMLAALQFIGGTAHADGIGHLATFCEQAMQSAPLGIVGDAPADCEIVSGPDGSRNSLGLMMKPTIVPK